MKNKCLLAALAVMLCLSVNAQQTRTPDGLIRCYTAEADAERRAENPLLGTNEDFENWLAPKVNEILRQQDAGERMALTTIPIIFHVIHDGEAVGTGNNVSNALIMAQIDQLNQDFRKFGSGANSSPVGADTEIEFCAAAVSPTGATLSEPGVNRISASSKGWGSSPFGSCQGQNFDRTEIENIVKPESIWNPDDYLNIWVLEMSCGILGYAQFPSNSGLGGFNSNEGGASTDGVAVIGSSIGSMANPNPAGGSYNKGRTLTHEVGHWIGLRHIWGDGGCSVDDYVNDTPTSDGANYGCSNSTSCSSTDMIENYMDYTDDNCMNIFTVGQKARMQAVLANSPRRGSLANSSKCGTGTTDTQAPTTPTNLSATNIAQTTATLTWNASSDNVGVTGYDIALNGSVIGTTTGTSANLTGLTASTSYSATVTAKDAAGNSSSAASTSFTTLANSGSNCASENLTLTLVFDNYPEETSWTIKNSGGTTVESGGTYGSQADGSTLNINLTLADGNYTFAITDAYGDGICCSYGNGSYSLTSGGTSYANGGSFGSTESTNFCVEGSGPAPDTQAPSTPSNVSASNIAQTTADVSWTASTDNVGVVSYQLFLNGSSIGTTSGTSTSLTGLTANTTYTVGVVASDAAGNTSATGSTSFTTLSNGGGSGSDELFAHYFESGWDGWSDGGSDCYRYSGSRSYEGTRSIRLRDNSGTASAMTLSNVNVSGYDELELTFFFYAYSMENGEDFWVRFNDGSGWQTVATYARGTAFNNNTFYSATVTLSAGDFNFGSNAQFRIQCDASANGDQVYIDEVTLTGINTSSRNESNFTLKEIEGQDQLVSQESNYKETLDSQNELVVYPNPASHEVTIKTNFENNTIRVFSISGVLVNEFRLSGTKTTIDISDLKAGTYIIQAESKDGVSISKFVKQ